jgi:hypothetical protein
MDVIELWAYILTNKYIAIGLFTLSLSLAITEGYHIGQRRRGR